MKRIFEKMDMLSTIIVIMIVAFALTMVITAARAAEITVKVSDADQQAFTNLPGAVDQCVAGLQLRGDANMCKAIAQFATEFGAKVKAAAPPPEPPAK